MARRRLAEALTDARRRKNLTQEDVANALGINHAAVSRWERGLNVPSSRRVIELADLLELDSTEMLVLINEAARADFQELRRDYDGLMDEVRTIRDDAAAGIDRIVKLEGAFNQSLTQLAQLVRRIEANTKVLEEINQPHAPENSRRPRAPRSA